MKDTFICTLSEEEFRLVSAHNVGKVIFTNKAEPTERLEFYVCTEDDIFSAVGKE